MVEEINKVSTLEDTRSVIVMETSLIQSKLVKPHVALGGENEIVGVIWTLLISCIAIQKDVFNKGINILGIIVRVAGILTIVPSLFDYTIMIFALG